jgi:RimJ/RimL family protein N-acetyltransferase
MDIKVREASESDSEDIFTWRNDETTRRMSFTSDKVDWLGHSKWFESSLKNKQRALYICEYFSSKRSIGIVRFDIDTNNAIISINLNPSERGKGLSKECIKESINRFIEDYVDIKEIWAEIKQSNKASQCAFISVGFEFIKQSGETLEYQFKIQR